MKRIMIVDDDPDILKYCESVLGAKGHEVVTCSSAEKALGILASHSVDLLVIDVSMPKMSGFDLLKARHSIPHFHAPVMMLTGRSSVRDIQTALSLGASEYMVKPIDREVFLAKFDSLLGGDGDEFGDVRFAEATGLGMAEITTPALIAAVSEMGLTLRTQSYVDRNLRLKISSPIFEEIGIPCPPLRASWCKPLERDAQYQYEVFVSFIGLDEPTMRKIRVWVAAQTIKRVRTANS